MSCFDHDQSRRAFLKRAGTLGLAGVATPFVTSLAAIGEAAASVATDYKALVCVFLYGGNDYANTLPPYDQASYNLYNAARSNIALSRDALANTILNPTNSLGGRQYAMAPTMAPMASLFDAGKLAVALNVGTLVQPTTKAQYNANSVKLPPKLFSHNDQQSYFQASNPEGATSGWGGRIGDLFQSGNGSATLTCVNASGNAVYLTGKAAVQYAVGTGGPIPLVNNATSLYSSTTAMSTLKSLITANGAANILANEHARVTKRALDTYTQLSGALANAPVANFPLFPSGNSLADQLKIVARMISVSNELGAKRQVFFVSLGGFDMHDFLVRDHPTQTALVANALNAFYQTTANLGVADKVTTFTASDFGRTLQSNDDGSDHGWGSHHFVMGGAVNGKKIYGTAPAVGNGTNDDVGQGRLLPTLSVDQYAATLASWFGVSNSDMATVLPNIGNYNQSTWNIGFV
ncbi:MAG: DUF1501 domain-containing protein [Sphingomonas sp.]|uniref:DUF1501 domain-containing protein n=1 Tax=Sphingomonas sp. TaxID=28214 RepID=UPI001AC016E9|nr:DUF1501 domain-containing protein [Sphingomonas sp.]MBN8809542.1 DUF1501 domain-containing protein [Sphingomonas sp.]